MWSANVVVAKIMVDQLSSTLTHQCIIGLLGVSGQSLQNMLDNFLSLCKVYSSVQYLGGMRWVDMLFSCLPMLRPSIYGKNR